MSWKSVNVKSTEKVITTAMIGVSSGSVTFQNCCQGVAPSIEEASYRDGGMVCRPASREIATKGTPRQMFAAVTESRASQGSPRKSMYRSIRPIFARVQLTTENWESQIHQQ